MTDEQIELARRVIACKGWRWMGGMQLVHLPTHAGATGYYFRVPQDNYVSLPSEYPDLTDPATLGCLLALVREAWGDPYLCCVGELETGWRLDGYAAVEDIHSYRSEAEALVRALEKAP